MPVVDLEISRSGLQDNRACFLSLPTPEPPAALGNSGILFLARIARLEFKVLRSLQQDYLLPRRNAKSLSSAYRGNSSRTGFCKEE